LRKNPLPLFAWLGVCIAAGGVFLFLKTVTVLSVTNMDHPGSFHFEISPLEEVTLFHINSIYDAYVEEVFQVVNGKMLLKAVRTNSPAVMEYYGFEDTAPVQTLHRDMGPALRVQASMRQDQGLRIRGRTLHWSSIASGGDRILVSVDQVAWATSLWRAAFHNDGINPSTKH
jgi:hypothetical protein